MNTSFRDDAIAKNKLILRLTLIWALSSTLAVIILSGFCVYTLTHRQIHWLPVCTGGDFSIGMSTYSPSYLRKMTKKVADLRLTYNPETIEARHAMLLHLVTAKHQDSFNKQLDTEHIAVHEKNVSSVFYDEKISVDVFHHQAQIEGLLYRTSHGLQLKPQRKRYQVQFSFTNGLLELLSIKEVHHA